MALALDVTACTKPHVNAATHSHSYTQPHKRTFTHATAQSHMQPHVHPCTCACVRIPTRGGMRCAQTATLKQRGDMLAQARVLPLGATQVGACTAWEHVSHAEARGKHLPEPATAAAAAPAPAPAPAEMAGRPEDEPRMMGAALDNGKVEPPPPPPPPPSPSLNP